MPNVIFHLYTCIIDHKKHHVPPFLSTKKVYLVKKKVRFLWRCNNWFNDSLRTDYQSIKRREAIFICTYFQLPWEDF